MARSLGLTEARVVRSEWLKFWSLRSRFVTLGISAIGVAAIGAIAAGVVDTSALDGDPAARAAVASLGVLPIVLGVLGVLSATNEYAGGLIRATFAAVPSRTPVMRAKALVLAAIATATVAATALAAYGLGALTYDGGAAYGSPFDGDVIRFVGAAALEAVGYALLGLGLGLLLRNGAGAISTLMGLVMVVPIVVSLIPWMSDTVGPYLISSAQMAVAGSGTDDLLPVPAALAVFAAWVAVPLVVAVVVTRRRDA
ncbi:MAG: ABC transporter permease [Acidimicrobiales bacterium]